MNYDHAREQMIEEQLLPRGIRDARVIVAMRRVPRHLFVDPALQHKAYDDAPLPIDDQQTISQPYMVALMTQLLELTGGERVLEIGTGSGYQAAVLAELGAEVFTIERIMHLADDARARLDRLGYGGRVHGRVADGGSGWAEAAPFHAIIVTAAVQHVPRPVVEQLAPGGCVVLPLGEADLQGLARIRKQSGGLQMDYYGECRFVKMIGEYGWEA